MKTRTNLILSIFLFLGITFTGCTASSPQVIVGSDSKLGEPIRQFKTYSWTADVDNIPTNQIFIGPNGVYVFNNTSTRNQIKEAVQYELSARGFKIDTTNPDMLLNYVIFEQEGDLKTFNGYQVVNGLDSIRTPENVSTVTVKPGTLLITAVGTESGNVVWQGYASGILSPSSVKDPAKVKSSVQQIFNKFDYKAAAN